MTLVVTWVYSLWCVVIASSMPAPQAGSTGCHPCLRRSFQRCSAMRAHCLASVCCYRLTPLGRGPMSAHPCETVCANQMPIRIWSGLQKRRRDSWGLVAEKVLSLEANKDTATAGESTEIRETWSPLESSQRRSEWVINYWWNLVFFWRLIPLYLFDQVALD